MKANNKDLKKQIQRIKDLILQYQYRYRNGITRRKMFSHIELLKKVEDAINSAKPDEIAIGEYFKQLEKAD